MLLSAKAMRFAELVASNAPLALTSPAIRLASRGLARFSPDDRIIVERNLRRAYGRDLTPEELDAGVREVFESYGRYWLDAMRLPSMDLADVDRGFSYGGLHNLTDPIEAGLGPVMALPHIGGWEWAGPWLNKVHGWKVTAVAERLEPPEMFDWFVDFRNRIGMEIVPLGPQAAASIATHIADGAIIALMCDRDISGDGIEVEFFGERTRLPGGPALLALRSGSPLVPCGIYFEGDHVHAEVLPAIDTERRGKIRADVSRVTQDLAYALETLIRRAPEQWHLLQPNWPSDYVALGREVPEGLRSLLPPD